MSSSGKASLVTPIRLLACRALGFLAHLACGGECGIDIEDIERLLDDDVA
jgi:hypothetical protein